MVFREDGRKGGREWQCPGVMAYEKRNGILRGGNGRDDKSEPRRHIGLGEDGEGCGKMDRSGDQEIVEYKNPWFRVIRKGKFYYVDEPMAHNAAVVFIEFQGQLVLIEQYRVAAGCVLLATPRGYGEGQETSAACAVREAFEETGFRVSERDLKYLGKVRPNSAILTSVVDVYFGVAKENRAEHLDTEEVARVVLCSYDEFERKMTDGYVTDGFTLAGYLLLRMKRESG